jgi:hypothetical protein
LPEAGVVGPSSARLQGNDYQPYPDLKSWIKQASVVLLTLLTQYRP